jgi:hypothetical protein
VNHLCYFTTWGPRISSKWRVWPSASKRLETRDLKANHELDEDEWSASRTFCFVPKNEILVTTIAGSSFHSITYIKNILSVEECQITTFMAGSRVRTQASPCGICGLKGSTGLGFSPSPSVFLYQLSPDQRWIFIHSTSTLNGMLRDVLAKGLEID